MPTSLRAFFSALTAVAVLAASPIRTAHAQQVQQVPQAQPAPVVQVQVQQGPQPAPNTTTQLPIYIVQAAPAPAPVATAPAGPHEITDWDSDSPVPAGYHVVGRARKGPIVGGAVTFGVLYFFSILAAAASADANHGNSNAAALYIPAVGPFLQATQSDSQSSKVTLVADGIGQTVGLALLIYGLTSPKNVLVRNDYAKATITPMRMGQSGFGLGLSGSF
jgi:hypothetical protein